MKKKFIFYILLFLFIILFFISGYNIFIWYLDNKRTNDMVLDIKDSTNVIEDDNGIRVDFNSLLKKNDEVVGWIRVNGTNIDYPYLKHSDNKFYLSHSFDKSYNNSGWLFLDYRNNAKELDRNNIIYAHGRVDGSMFGSLMNTLKDSWFNDSNNHYVYISTNTYDYVFKVFSIYKIKTTDDYIKINFNEDEFIKFIDMIKKRSIYKFGVDVLSNDKIITLSTCYNNGLDYKLVLHAKLVSKSENILTKS